MWCVVIFVLSYATYSTAFMDVTDWDSNCSEKTQMLLKKTQRSTSLAQHQGGEGGIWVFFQSLWVFVNYFHLLCLLLYVRDAVFNFYVEYPFYLSSFYSWPGTSITNHSFFFLYFHIYFSDHNDVFVAIELGFSKASTGNKDNSNICPSKYF